MTAQLDHFINRRPDPREARALHPNISDESLVQLAAALRDRGHGDLVTYSPKVFIPLTVLCRDVCHYCTFARQPRGHGQAYLSDSQILEIAGSGDQHGCHEALFTLGDKPELRYRAARDGLRRMGFGSTAEYLVHAAGLVFDQTGLLPHINAGILSFDEMSALREVSASQGIMLESASERLTERGGPHYGSPDKQPGVRLANIELAGRLKIPFSTGILIGIGETRRERIDSLLAIRELNDSYGHIQELILQPFRPKPGTLMAAHPPASGDELAWTIAVARILFGPEMSIQTPPNLSPGAETQLIAAGVNDWGGISPVTIDHINPEAPWPQIKLLSEKTARAGKILAARLPVYPRFIKEAKAWISPRISDRVRLQSDASGLARADRWYPGELTEPPSGAESFLSCGVRGAIGQILGRAENGRNLSETEIIRLFLARGEEFTDVCGFADGLRNEVNGSDVTYVVNRNINYTNICHFRCGFCAFAKSSTRKGLRDRPYLLDTQEITRRSVEAWERGATEVCLQGGINPDFTGNTYLSICRAIREVLPDIHIHAFSPLEIQQGAETLGIGIREFLAALKEAGLSTLPGTAAEILDDGIRQIICPDKINTAQWLEVIETAHGLGLRTTATIMFGHVEHPTHWARHLLLIRELQSRTGGFTEFVPLPFIGKETPLFLRGNARCGPTFRECILMHAVSRIVLHPHISNIQASWPKMGRSAVSLLLAAGVNDLGGTLMNESISRAAGTRHGQELQPEEMDELIRECGRIPAQRTTLYDRPSSGRISCSYDAAELLSVGATAASIPPGNRGPAAWP
ncbi:MAG: 5-amino-6-(D-ribitylamino)uracil--L-tyrosine 4-hydroxyphenyl transferase CofH [Arenicellales bacterium]|nr:5-amino-6-(D-ribitylamino)uracil--L-tyrosine 4-hydroxyphenyl transferase CofH [Arenicellales bacterium]